MPVLRYTFILLLFQFLGEVLHALARMPVPGPVLGMLLLAGWYTVRRREPPPAMQQTANGLLGSLALLFVPAGVGIVANLPLLRAAWLPITLSLVGSTLVTLTGTAWLMHRLSRRIA